MDNQVKNQISIILCKYIVMSLLKIPVRYLPRKLTRKDKKRQVAMLMKSRRLYKKNKYFYSSARQSFKFLSCQHSTCLNFWTFFQNF